MTQVIGGLVVAIALAGCGDNSKQCGPGTEDVDNDGICETEPSGPKCGDGTVFDMLTQMCVVDGSVCRDGTVLIRGQCRNPDTDIEVDLLEGPEPNGFESDAIPAGTIIVPALGAKGFVFRGCVQPVDDVADFDVYVVTVASPTLLHIAADGVQGLIAGFEVQAVNGGPLLANWRRLGINNGGDTAQRQVWLPAAGTYTLAITDARTIFPITQGGRGEPAAGNPDGTSCYFVTVETDGVPVATPVDVAGHTGMISEQLAFFTGPFPSATPRFTAAIDPDPPAVDSRAAASLVLMVDNVLVKRADANARDEVARLVSPTVSPGQTPLLVLDYVWNMTLDPADFRVTVAP